jgi:hypothetical protein
MKALTICQPWAWAIAQGLKLVENRSWSTNYRGPLAIHAGQSIKWYSDGKQWIERETGLLVPDYMSIDRGFVLGVVDLYDCVRYGSSRELQSDPWASGPWCWCLRDFRALPQPLPFSGQQGLFDIPDHKLLVAN